MGRFASCRKYRTNYAALKEWAELVNPSGCHKRLGSHRIANCSYLYSFNQLVWIRLQFNTWQPFCLYAHNVEIRFLGTVVKHPSLVGTRPSTLKTPITSRETSATLSTVIAGLSPGFTA